MAKKYRQKFKLYEIIFVIETRMSIKEISIYLGTTYMSIANLIYKLRKERYRVRKKRRGHFYDKE